MYFSTPSVIPYLLQWKDKNGNNGVFTYAGTLLLSLTMFFLGHQRTKVENIFEIIQPCLYT